MTEDGSKSLEAMGMFILSLDNVYLRCVEIRTWAAISAQGGDGNWGLYCHFKNNSLIVKEMAFTDEWCDVLNDDWDQFLAILIHHKANVSIQQTIHNSGQGMTFKVTSSISVPAKHNS